MILINIEINWYRVRFFYDIFYDMIMSVSAVVASSATVADSEDDYKDRVSRYIFTIAYTP